MTTAKDNILLIPGCDDGSGNQGNEALGRTIMGAKAFKTGSYAAIVTSAGNNGGDCLARELAKLGIPPDHILVENEARDSFENLLLSEKIWGKAGLQVKGVTIVTEPLHYRRLATTAKAMGLETVNIPTNVNMSCFRWCKEQAMYILHRLDPLGRGPLARLHRRHHGK